MRNFDSLKSLEPLSVKVSPEDEGEGGDAGEGGNGDGDGGKDDDGGGAIFVSTICEVVSIGGGDWCLSSTNGATVK